MDLRRRLLQAAMSRPAFLIATSPGGTRERLAVEAELARRGWPQAAGPADADLFVTAGPAEAATELGEWTSRIWQAIPAPRARITVANAKDAAAALDRGHGELRAGVVVARETPEEHAHPTREAGDHDQLATHDQADGASHGPDQGGSHGEPSGGSYGDAHGGAQGDHGHEGHQMAGGHHGHHGQGMSMVVDGLPMADTADDRDGLRLDRLHPSLGPVLADWPAGLILRLALQGDVLQDVAVETVPLPPVRSPSFWDEPWLRAAAGEPVTRGAAERRRCAAHLDSLGRFFGVTGWGDLAGRSRHARDLALAGAPQHELAALVRRIVRRAERSRTLRWLLTGVGVLTAEHARHLGVGGPALTAGGDAHARLLVWLGEARRSASACDDPAPLVPDEEPFGGPRGSLDGAVPPSQGLLDALPGLLVGTEFACARIIVASLDPDLDQLAPRTAEARHG